MRAFIILIPVSERSIDGRKACELIENFKFKNVVPSPENVLKKVMEVLNLESSYNIEVEPITDFMDRVNNQEFDPEKYFISYVYFY